MKARTEYILKSIAKYAPIWTGVGIMASSAILSLTGCVFAMVNEPKLNSYLEAPIIQQAAEEAKIGIANDIASGKINAEDYGRKLEEAKLEKAKEIYKNDEEFQAILKRQETLMKVVPIEAVMFVPGGMLTFAGILPLFLINPDEITTKRKWARIADGITSGLVDLKNVDIDSWKDMENEDN